MLQLELKNLVSETFKIKPAENSQKVIKLWEKSSFERTKVGVISTKQKVQSSGNILDGPTQV